MEDVPAINEYDDADDEIDALRASHAMQAHVAIFRYLCDSELSAASEAGCPWAEKVEDLLWEAARTLERMARDEVEQRPGMLEIGRAYQKAWAEKHAIEHSEIEKTFADLP